MVYYLIIAALVLGFMLPALMSLRRRRHFAVIARADEEDLDLNVVTLAQSMTVRDRAGVGIPLHETLHEIKRAFRLVKNSVRQGKRLNECEKWLYENGNFILSSVVKKRLLSLNLLPRSRGKIRAVALTHLLTSLDRCEVYIDRCTSGVKLFNKYAPLTEEEIFSLPAAFEYSLLRHISRMCKRIVKMHKAAYFAEKDESFQPSHSALPGYTYYCKLSGKLTGEEDIETGRESAEVTFGVYIADTALLLAGAIKSLKTLADVTLPTLLEMSPVDEIYRSDETYRNMDETSKKLYLTATGAFARYANMSERNVAERVLEQARKREVHFGTLLFESRKVLYRLLKGKNLPPSGGRNRAAFFFAAVFALDLALSCVAAVLMPSAALSAGVFFATFFGVLIPVEYLIVRTLGTFLPTRPVPRLKLDKIPEQGRVLTVVSELITSKESAVNALCNIRALRCANKDENAGFVLLADLKKADNERSEDDAAVLDILSEAEEEKDIFVLVRRRTKCGGTWCGRERKRGAIEDLNSLLLRGDSSAFEYISSTPFTPVFVILLDSDSKLGVGGVKRAVGAAIHPLASKYDILSFGCRYNLSSVKTLYSLRYLRESGTEEYCSYSDFYYNLCKQSVFCGKGIYNLKRFDKKLRGVLPQGKVLSHDIAEGALTNCAAAGDFVYEDIPPTFAAEAARTERWHRGDLLLLPLAFSANRVHPLYRYIILRNAIRVFSPVAMLAALIAALVLGSVPLAAVVGICLLAVPLIQAGFALYSLASGVRLRYALSEFISAILGGMEGIVMLPFYATSSIIVVIKTLYRCIFRKNLLEWRTFAGTMHEPLSAHFAAIFPGILLLAVLAGTLYMHTAVLVYAAVGIAYACLTAVGNIRLKGHKCNSDAFLRGVATDTYSYFSYMREKTPLIADNYSFETGGRIADMTSPTNLGMGVLAHVCAAECGITDIATAVKRIDEDVARLGKLKTWRGNFYNWYSSSGEVKHPAFISSVDNGNLAACLITARAFLRRHGCDFADIDRILDAMKLEALLDKHNGRFYIGYNKDSGIYEGHYDMLASEARILAYIASCRNINAWENLRRDIIGERGNMLVSWAGTAFEYLMPQIFFSDVPYSLLTHSCASACSIMSASACNGVFGISESGYYAFDDRGNYRYGQWGLEELALKSGENRCVISPYSSALMLKYKPRRAAANLKKLKKRGVYGKFGFCEAVDYSADGKLVCSYMTHHQGMLLAAITNALKGNVISRLFMSDDYMRGGELMLEERLPRTVSARKPKADFVYANSAASSFFRTSDGAGDLKVALLSEDKYSAAFTESGCGYAIYNGYMVNRWRKDPKRADGGFFIVTDGADEYSPTYIPQKSEEEKYTFTYNTESAEYENISRSCKMKVFLLTGAVGEMRKLTVKNSSDKVKEYDISYSERLSMAREEEYLSHPVYSDMFVSAQRTESGVILEKRGRGEEKDFYAAVKLHGAKDVRYNCNAAKEYRGTGYEFNDVLYPIISIKCKLTISPGESKDVYILKAFSNDKEELEKYIADMDEENYYAYCERCASMYSLRTSKYRSFGAVNELIDELAPVMVYNVQSAQKIQPYNLTSLGKIFVIDYERDFHLLESAICAILYMNLCGLSCKLYVVLDKSDRYYPHKRDYVLHATCAGNIEKLNIVHIKDILQIKSELPRPIVYFTDLLYGNVRRESEDNSPGYGNGQDVSRGAIGDVIKDGYEPSLDNYFEENIEEDSQNIHIFASVKKFRKGISEHIYKPKIALKSGYGYFTVGENYVISSPTPLPYSNVIADEKGGCVVTEMGGGFTFGENACEEKLSVWNNDPAEDVPSERIYLAVDDSLTQVNRIQAGGYVEHGRGFTCFEGMAEGFRYLLQTGIIRNGECRVYRLLIKNVHGKESADIIFDMDFLLGRIYDPWGLNISERGGCIAAENLVTGKRAFVRCLQGGNVQVFHSYMCAKSGSIYYEEVGMGKYNVPCAQIVKSLILPVGECAEVDFLIGAEGNTLLSMSADDVNDEWKKQLRKFENICKIRFEGVPAEEKLLMELLPYQVYSSRLSGRCGYYQAGGAIGFRDQLQDCLAHIYSDPDYVADMIVECAAHQYEEGDVMHWWHRPCLGVRTRITDDRLFLGYVTAEYIEHTGDKGILDREIPYLHSAILKDGEESRLETGVYAGEKGTLSDHILRAVDSAANRGEHGLLLIGGGDWNDALNGIGLGGRGESVWLTEFAVCVIKKILPLMDVGMRGDYIRLVAELSDAVNNAYFDGRYARAFTDGGVWLGRDNSPACKVDIISQAWAVISGIANTERIKSCMAHAKKLIDEDAGVVRLLAPPFEKTFDCGYISAYPKGVRENGGQYTHGAIWLFKAFCMAGDAEYAQKLAKILNPIYLCEGDGKDRYCAEPYVIAADVYYNKDMKGRAGWSWYTGSAAWYYKTYLEDYLGFRIRNGAIECRRPIARDVRPIITFTHKEAEFCVRYDYGDRDCVIENGVMLTGVPVSIDRAKGRYEITFIFKRKEN